MIIEINSWKKNLKKKNYISKCASMSFQLSIIEVLFHYTLFTYRKCNILSEVFKIALMILNITFCIKFKYCLRCYVMRKIIGKVTKHLF